ESNRFDFDLNITWQPGHFDSGPRRRLVTKELAVSLIHPRKVVHVFEKNGCLDDIVERESGRFQNRPQILDHARSLLFNAPSDKLHRFRIEWYLSAEKDKAMLSHSRRIRARRLRPVRGRADFFHCSSILITHPGRAGGENELFP